VGTTGQIAATTTVATAGQIIATTHLEEEVKEV
jgi:hypothetical protein